MFIRKLNFNGIFGVCFFYSFSFTILLHRETILQARDVKKHERETISTQTQRSLSLYVARVPKTVRTKTELYEIKLEKNKKTKKEAYFFEFIYFL